MKIRIEDLKNVAAKLNLAIEKTKLNPKSGWIEIKKENNELILKVANYDYYVNVVLPIDTNDDEPFHATISSETFIPLVAKLDCEYANMVETSQAVLLSTDTSEYTLPLIKEMGRIKTIDEIGFNEDAAISTIVFGSDLASIASINARGLVDSLFSKEIQQYIYVDNVGALTFTENMYVNDFEHKNEQKYKFLLNSTQAKLMSIFKGYDEVKLFIMEAVEYNSANKIKFKSDNLSLTLIVQSQNLTDTFPSIRLRKLAEVSRSTHVVLDKKAIDKALSRLMVFDRKFDITVMNYSKLVFTEKELRLVSIRNKNYEVIPYLRSENAFEHESVIRFADLIKQLKAINSKEVDISYGDTPAITINAEDVTQLIPEIRVVERV